MKHAFSNSQEKITKPHRNKRKIIRYYQRKSGSSDPSINLIFIIISIFFLGSSLFLIIIPALDFLTTLQFPETRCTIVSKGLEELQSFSSGSRGGIRSTSVYVPLFTYTVHIPHHDLYRVTGYRLHNSPAISQEDGQRILDSYEVGKSYSCLYDPNNLQHVFLVSDFNFFPFLSGCCFLVLGLFFLPAGTLGRMRNWLRK